MLSEDQRKCAGILIVDDDSIVRESFAEMLQGAGYGRVYQACDGLECLRRLEQHAGQIDLLLLDLRMPEMGGFEVVEHLSNSYKHVVGIVVISGFVTPDTEARLEAMSTDTVFTANVSHKPIVPEELLLIVAEAVASVYEKRFWLAERTLGDTVRALRSIENDIQKILVALPSLAPHKRSLAEELGIEMLKVILIAAFVLALLSFGVDDFLRGILR